MSKLKHSRFDCTPGCSVEAAIGLIDGKWKSIILWHLLEDHVLRFNELSKKIPNITQKMLTRQLRELEEDQIITRKVYPIVPPKVEYSLSSLGLSLSPILIALKEWGDQNISLYGKPKEFSTI
ncbi:helix-turn-helix domain-containing protein [Acinetobacter sichuanensis]|uniref:winged helix-turn-helix transcriptional regulator n=1 Tax=Acinetobacter sichuanensis TaxID=2136183 RepID=UPI00280EC46E|nr:helix-turn-helix domain-containing protein [Acinetobacter sichuanensis]MDQ9021850.1 helix-turn-helix domain-containing protein [Acinetobacter sichuanensis]